MKIGLASKDVSIKTNPTGEMVTRVLEVPNDKRVIDLLRALQPYGVGGLDRYELKAPLTDEVGYVELHRCKGEDPLIDRTWYKVNALGWGEEASDPVINFLRGEEKPSFEKPSS